MVRVAAPDSSDEREGLVLTVVLIEGDDEAEDVVDGCVPVISAVAEVVDVGFPEGVIVTSLLAESIAVALKMSDAEPMDELVTEAGAVSLTLLIGDAVDEIALDAESDLAEDSEGDELSVGIWVGAAEVDKVPLELSHCEEIGVEENV